MPTTWVLVSNASLARLFEGEEEGEWRLIEEHQHPASRDRVLSMVTDRTGRSPKRGSASHSVALEPHSSPKEVEAERFAASLAELLERGLDRGAYTRLYLAAPPHFLGLLRAHLSERVRRQLSASLDKDLTQLAARDLPAGLWALS